jgi:hypothetical protein
VVASAALFVLRVTAAIAFALGLAAVTATVATSLIAGGAEWVAPIRTTALMGGAFLGLGAIGMSFVMPSRAELTRQIPGGRDGRVPLVVTLALAILAILAIVHVPSLMEWWERNLALARRITGGTVDPMGLHAIPYGVLASTPAMASISVLTVVVSCVLGLVVPGARVRRVIGAASMLIGGYAGGLYATESAIRRMSDAMRRLADTTATPADLPQIVDWLGQLDAAIGTFSVHLVWLFAGSLAILALASATMGTPPRSSSTGTRTPPVVVPAAIGAAPVQPQSVPLGSTDFDRSDYAIRPRRAWLEAFVWRHAEYDIESIPPATRARFAFSWTTRTIDRAADGQALFAIRAQGGGGLLGGQSYDVIDARTGAAIGALVPVASDWELRDERGSVVAHVLEIEKAAGRARFVVKRGEQEIARFVWGFTGMTVASAELQIEFLPGADARVRILAIALAPILEHRARRASRWRS